MAAVVTVSTLDEYIWAAGVALQTTLCAVLVWRRIWKRFPAFTCYVAYELLQSALLFCVFTRVVNQRYEEIFWITTAIDYVAVLAVIFELTHSFFFIRGHWVPGVRAFVAVLTVTAVFISTSASLTLSPPHTVGHDLLASRGTCFISVLVCCLFAGLSWMASTIITVMPSSTWAVWVGFVVSCGSSMLQTVNNVVFGWHHGDRLIDHCVNGIILCVLVFWIVFFGIRNTPSHPSLGRL